MTQSADIATTAFTNGEPPRFATPWGPPQNWSMVIPGVWQCHTASHGGWWLTPERLEAMPDELKADTFGNSGAWFEEDSDWALIVRAFPNEFSEEMRAHAEGDRLWRAKAARLDAAQTDNDICSALTVQPADFQPSAEDLAAAQNALGPLVIVADRCGRLAIVRGYREARERAFAEERHARIADCIATGLAPDDLIPGCHAWRCYQPATNTRRWAGPWGDENTPGA